jgi:hypothetical protein
MTTTARWNALRWFADHALDINKVMGRRIPSTKMRNVMVRDGQLMCRPAGSFKYHRFELTARGQAMLVGKRKRKKQVVEQQLSEAIP